MLAKRIIACLDVKAGKVVKGVQFRDHKAMGDIIDLAARYANAGVDELVFYDITASSEQRRVDRDWVAKVAAELAIPFCVAGGIRTVEDAEMVLHAGADKISINSPALERPDLINQLVAIFGSQCVVVGVDSYHQNGVYHVYQYTGDQNKMQRSQRDTKDWVREVSGRGAGEIVLNCMNQDGMRKGYDIQQLKTMRALTTLPLIASGGAGCVEDFVEVFTKTGVDGALAASVFHQGDVEVNALKATLAQQKIPVRWHEGIQ